VGGAIVGGSRVAAGVETGEHAARRRPRPAHRATTGLREGLDEDGFRMFMTSQSMRDFALDYRFTQLIQSNRTVRAR
jgi:hypothetical protein